MTLAMTSQPAVCARDSSYLPCVAVVALAAVLTMAQAAPSRVAVWIDTDPAIGEKERDVDDGLALVQAFRSPELEIRGVSVVFGNAPLDRGLPIARRIVRSVGPPRLQVLAGAASAADAKVETEASRALATALRAAPLTILALGPATNVATTLAKHPELASRVTRIIAVAGRRPGQRFTTGTSNARGHRDFNFELDPGSFQVLLDSNAEVVLAPFEISSKIWLTGSDLDRLAASPCRDRARPRFSGACVARLVDAALRRRRLQSVRHAGGRLCDFFEGLWLRAIAGPHRHAAGRCDGTGRAGSAGRSQTVPAGVTGSRRRRGARHLLFDGAAELQAGSAGPADAMTRPSRAPGAAILHRPRARGTRRRQLRSRATIAMLR